MFKTLLFKNTKKLIIYEENGELKSTSFNDVLGWMAPEVVSLTKKYPRSNGSKIFIPTSIYISFNKDNNIVTASWETQSGFMVRRYTPNLGWQSEKQVIAIANPAERGYLRTVTNNDGTALAVWTQINSVNNKTEIFSAIFN
jgi:hypothetical protein